MQQEESINAISIFLDLASEHCQPVITSPHDHYEQSKSSEQCEIIHVSETNGVGLISESSYFSQKQNQIKNLLNNFKNHVLEIKDKNMMEQYCQLYQSNSITYSNLKKIVSKRVKDKQTRWNMKLKSLLKSNHLNQIFFYYLQNESMNWLKKSKVQEKESIIELIGRLIQYQKNNIFFDKIKVYKK